MVLGKKVANFDWEWGRNSAPRDGQKIPCLQKDLFLNKGKKSKKKDIYIYIYIFFYFS